MQPSPRNRWIDALSVLFAAAPFGFASIRAVRTGHDLRYLWVALASLAGAIVVITIVRGNAGRTSAGMALAAGCFFTSTLLAVLMALLLGTTLGPGIIVVASAFGFCYAVGSWFYARSGRTREGG